VARSLILGPVLMDPTPFDLWLASHVAGLLGRHPLFDRCVESGIHHNVLGGVWYAAALFILWSRAVKPGGEFARRRILTTLAGTLIAILFTLLAGALISWPPPYHHPHLYPIYSKYLEPNPNTNCFPSQSTALYGAVAAGVYSLHRLMGCALWIGVLVLVAFPRMYVGGHYPSDILAGLVLGLGGYLSARYFLERRWVARLEQLFDPNQRFYVLWQALIFAWILQVAIEFGDAVWAKNSLLYFLSR